MGVRPINVGAVGFVDFSDEFFTLLASSHPGGEIKHVFVGRVIKHRLNIGSYVRRIPIGAMNHQSNAALAVGSFC